MSKPDWCPQDVWDIASEWHEAIDIWRTLPGASPDYPAVFFARAILAAKAEERDEIAEMVEVFADTADFSARNAENADEITAFCIEEGALRGTASAIRKRGEA